MSDLWAGCSRENLMVSVIACWLLHTALTELQNHFIFPEDAKWKGGLSATNPCFIGEIKDE